MAWDTNARHIRAAIAAARDARRRASSACPSCASPATAARTCTSRPACSGPRSTCCRSSFPTRRALFTCFGLPVFYEGALYNAAAVACDGRLLGSRRQAAPGRRRHPLRAALVPPLAAGVVGSIEIGGSEYPIGDLLFDCGGVRIGFEICRDAWVADRTGARLAQRGADILLNPSASHFAFAKQQIRERFVLEGSRAFASATPTRTCSATKRAERSTTAARSSPPAARCWPAARGSRLPIGC